MIPTCYVLTDEGDILLRVNDETAESGFSLTDGTYASEAADSLAHTWPNGDIISEGWICLDHNDPRITKEHHEKMDHLC